MNNYPEDSQKQIQQNALENVSVGGNLSIGQLQQIINLTPQLNNPKNSFCGLINWIYKKSDSNYLEDLHPEYAKDILKIIKQVPYEKKLDFTPIETRVLSLVLNYCHYYSQGAKARSEEFFNFIEEDYLFELNKLASTQHKIRSQSVKLSDLIADKKISLIVKRFENSDEF
ncbi:hypothetical protein NIES267_22460 [Calothrix parasitica NIES-267]|uniref:Uncharacterized protein n=1 Tax=Calothrix parasitica NIES-267 TaxID=1973488 RepID=A0A1Z4LNF3_9CYAN|nr:hypothetical protein NIES267_22460 [Calothrix parasitica NIES-267]